MKSLAKLRSSAPVRKGRAFALRAPRAAARAIMTPDSLVKRPPVLVNSLPKSGTHLLMQIAEALPGTRQYGTFIAQLTNSVLMRPRSQDSINRLIGSVVPGEIVGAHLHFCEETATAIEKINALHLFIYRDPRAVIVSEAFYLAEMNRWHRMHKHFAKLETLDVRLRLALDGIDDHFPDALTRILPFAGWLEAPGVLAIRYEDIVAERQVRDLRRIAEVFLCRSGLDNDDESLVQALMTAIQPDKSHTFRRGGADTWRKHLSPELVDELTGRLATALEKFGYDP